MLDRGDLLELIVDDSLLHHLLSVDQHRASSLDLALLPDGLPRILGRGVEMAVRVLVMVVLERLCLHLHTLAERCCAASLVDCLVQEASSRVLIASPTASRKLARAITSAISGIIG